MLQWYFYIIFLYLLVAEAFYDSTTELYDFTKMRVGKVLWKVVGYPLMWFAAYKIGFDMWQYVIMRILFFDFIYNWFTGKPLSIVWILKHSEYVYLFKIIKTIFHF